MSFDPHSKQETAPPLGSSATDQLNFFMLVEDYWHILLKRWWIFVLCLIVATGIGAYRAYLEPDIYMARGSLMVSPKIVVSASPAAGDAYHEEMANFYGTQIRLIQSRQVLLEVHKKLADLDRKLNPMPNPVLQVTRERDTSLFILTVTSTSADYSKQFLDLVMKEYIAHRKRIREATSENLTNTLLREIDRVDKERAVIEEKLFDFQKVNNLAYIEGQANVAVQHLIDLKRRLAELHTEIDFFDSQTLERQMDHMAAKNGDSVQVQKQNDGKPPDKNESASTTTIPQKLERPLEYTNIKNSLALLRTERESLSKYLRPKHSRMMELDNEIRSKEQMLHLLQVETKEKITAYRQMLRSQEEALRKSIEESEQESLSANKKSAEYALLKAEAQRSKELNDALLKQLQEIDVSQNTDQDTIAINEAASGPSTPIGPDRVRNIAVSALVGLIAALVLIIVLEKIDDRIRNVEELRHAIDEIVLGQVPLVAMERGSRSLLMTSNLLGNEMFSNSLRNVRSSLMFSSATSKLKTFAITSPFPGDGKTTIAVNLAICFSQLKACRTLLIDMDLRRMCVHKYFDIENKEGVLDILGGQAAFKDCIVPSGMPNLDILCAGSPVADPGELILTDQFKKLLEQVNSSYDRVVLDTSPILVTDDTLCLSSMVDGVILVFRVNRTSARHIRESLENIKQREAKVLGVVLNGIDITKARYYYYNYYYSNYYSQHHPKGSRSQSRVGSIPV